MQVLQPLHLTFKIIVVYIEIFAHISASSHLMLVLQPLHPTFKIIVVYIEIFGDISASSRSMQVIGMLLAPHSQPCLFHSLHHLPSKHLLLLPHPLMSLLHSPGACTPKYLSPG